MNAHFHVPAVNVELKPLAAAAVLPVEEIKELQAMKDSGKISDAEYERLKAEQMETLKAKNTQPDSTQAAEEKQL